VTGLELIGHHNIGDVVPGLREDVVQGHARDIGGIAKRIAHGGR